MVDRDESQSIFLVSDELRKNLFLDELLGEVMLALQDLPHPPAGPHQIVQTTSRREFAILTISIPKDSHNGLDSLG
jgi:hypothetical protein